MVQVSVISSTMVQPQNINRSGRVKIHLTPHDFDLLYLVYPQRGLLFPKPDPETQIIPRLKAALSTALDIYFPFAGRLVKVNNHEDHTVSFYIDCNDSGAKFVHAKAESVSATELLQSCNSAPDFRHLFFPANNLTSRDAINSEPLLIVQVTEMKDGVFMSFGINHMVADGPSIWNFLHTWSNICLNNLNPNFHPIVLKDWFLDKIHYPIHIPVSEIETSPNHETLTKDRVFHFSKKTILSLKSKANREIESIDLKISSLQAIVAYLWRTIIINSTLTREEEIHCKVAGDMRGRLNPPLEKECFGNVSDLAIATTTVGDLSDHGLGWAALQINKSVKSLTNESYKSFAENWVKNVNIPKSRSGYSLTVADSPRFKVYDNDFGWGKPVAVRAGVPVNGIIGGLLVMLPGVEEGSIDVHAILDSSLWSDVLGNLLSDDLIDM